MRHNARCAPSAALAAAVVCCVPVLLAAPAHAATLLVGPGQTYTTIASAVAAANDGDTVQVMAGVYVNDFAEISHKIKLTAIGGRVAMRATVPLPNEKGILVTDTDVTITGFNFYGAWVNPSAGGNGAGIRYQGGNLVINNCYFTDNQDGMLADPVSNGTVTINQSEFYRNGVTSGPMVGYTHNLYVDQVAVLDIENSYFHGANYGHEMKSRAAETIVRNTRIADGPTGTASYSIDLPNGGVAKIENVQIQKGPKSENPNMISFGEEGAVANSSLSVTGTLFENQLGPSAVGVQNTISTPVSVAGNQVFRLTAPDILQGAGTVTGTKTLLTAPVVSAVHPWLVAPAKN